VDREEIDPDSFLWQQVKLEAQIALDEEPAAGPQLYSFILSQPSLLRALINIISLEVETELMPATAIQSLFTQMLDPVEDGRTIQLDVIAAATRLSSHSTDALTAILFDKGLHALVCHRVSHRLWLAGRTSMAYYVQSTVSRVYSADLHPAARFGAGVYLNAGGGVVIGETAVVGDHVTILQGVTLGGTGKERGDRHPKIGKGVVLNVGATVLGNIAIGDFSIIGAKSLVNRPVPAGAQVSGIPGKVVGFRTVHLDDEEMEDCNYRDISNTTKHILQRLNFM
jgi:serine O-acetyltransferase